MLLFCLLWALQASQKAINSGFLPYFVAFSSFKLLERQLFQAFCSFLLLFHLPCLPKSNTGRHLGLGLLLFHLPCLPKSNTGRHLGLGLLLFRLPCSPKSNTGRHLGLVLLLFRLPCLLKSNTGRHWGLVLLLFHLLMPYPANALSCQCLILLMPYPANALSLRCLILPMPYLTYPRMRSKHSLSMAKSMVPSAARAVVSTVKSPS